MRIVDVSFYYDDAIVSEEALLQQHYTTVGWAEALLRKGVEIIVVKRFCRDNAFIKNGVQYYFVKDDFGGGLKDWQIPFGFLKRIVVLNADVIHVHTFPCALPTFLLRYMLPAKTALVVQNHGGKVAGGIKSKLYKWMSYVADAFFFTDAEQVKHWFSSKSKLRKVMPVMEGATFFDFENRDAARSFTYADRNIARKKTGIQGSPVFLWVGRLDENKDPLTVLDGLEMIFEKYTGATLHMVYNDYHLLDTIRQKISNSVTLKNKVYLAGELPHEGMETYYNSADYFVLGSHYEGSGYALSEALSCGCIPIITNIPSFHMMTDKGKLGALWQVGDKDSFVEAVNKAMAKPLQAEANACIEFYKQHLSFDAIAETAVRHYRDISNKRQQKVQ